MSALHDHEYADTPHFWLGVFSATMAQAVRELPENSRSVKKDLDRALRGYMASGVPSPESRNRLERMKR